MGFDHITQRITGKTGIGSFDGDGNARATNYRQLCQIIILEARRLLLLDYENIFIIIFYTT